METVSCQDKVSTDLWSTSVEKLQEGCTIIRQHIRHLDMILDINFTNDLMLHKHALGMAVVYVV